MGKQKAIEPNFLNLLQQAKAGDPKPLLAAWPTLKTTLFFTELTAKFPNAENKSVFSVLLNLAIIQPEYRDIVTYILENTAGEWLNEAELKEIAGVAGQNEWYQGLTAIIQARIMLQNELRNEATDPAAHKGKTDAASVALHTGYKNPYYDLATFYKKRWDPAMHAHMVSMIHKDSVHYRPETIFAMNYYLTQAQGEHKPEDKSRYLMAALRASFNIQDKAFIIKVLEATIPAYVKPTVEQYSKAADTILAGTISNAIMEWQKIQSKPEDFAKTETSATASTADVAAPAPVWTPQRDTVAVAGEVAGVAANAASHKHSEGKKYR